MSELTLTLETVTPLFLGGAEPRDKSPELRPPAFRGAMRYWLRAALGGVIGDSNLDELHKLESAVFGAADEKIGASAVNLRLGTQSLKPISYSEIAKYDRQKNIYEHPGLAYLFFAARGTQKERNGLLGQFSIRMIPRAGASNSESNFKRAYVSLWLVTHLGGLGSRARRGAGNLQIVSAQDDTGFELDKALPLQIQATTPNDLANKMGNGIKLAREMLGLQMPTQSTRNPSGYDILHPSVCELWVVNKMYETWQSALDEIGSIYQGFRKLRSPDYQTVKTAMTSNARTIAKPVERAGFGLPIQFYYRSLNGARAGLEGEEHDRRSSPFLIKVEKLSNGRYVLVLLWFHSVFLPAGEKLKLENRNMRAFGNVPDDGLVRTFITDSDSVNHSALKDKGLAVIEVSYD
jgi:CRISPR-associated protein Cmr1